MDVVVLDALLRDRLDRLGLGFFFDTRRLWFFMLRKSVLPPVFS
jgi:hypothetical protein